MWDEVIELLTARTIHTIILYGSRAGGFARSGSDTDLAIAGPEELSPEELSELYLSLSSLLGDAVDLVDLRRAQGLFLTEILTKGEYLLAADPEFLGRKAEEMMDYQTDLAPGVRAMLTARLSRSSYAE